MSPIDLSPIVDNLLVPLLTPILLALASWALAKVAGLAHFQITDGQRQVLETAIANGIAYAERTLAPGETISVDAKVAAAVNYVLPKIPGALNALGITPSHLTQLVTARLPA